jgi:hypothetical protein
MSDAIATLPWGELAYGLSVRVSTGFAALWSLTGRRPDRDAENLFRRADEALLEAKRRRAGGGMQPGWPVGGRRRRVAALDPGDDRAPTPPGGVRAAPPTPPRGTAHAHHLAPTTTRAGWSGEPSGPPTAPVTAPVPARLNGAEPNANWSDAGGETGEILMPLEAGAAGDTLPTPPQGAAAASRRRRPPVIDLRGAAPSRTPFG